MNDYAYDMVKKKLKSLKNKSVWITGASSGIGMELALIAAEAEASLILLASRYNALAEVGRLCSVKGAASVHYIAVDLSHEISTVKAVKQMLAEHGAPDYLILNAGITQRSLAGETDISVVKKVMAINFEGAVTVTRTLLPEILKSGGGHIAVTSSLVGKFGFPMRSAYAASKHALHGFFETIALEYFSQGIRVTFMLPGRVRTAISMNSLNGKGIRRNVMDPGNEKGMNPHVCAVKYWKALLRGSYEVILGDWKEKLMVSFRRRTPKIFRFIARRVSPF